MQPSEDLIVYDLVAIITGVREFHYEERFEKKAAAFEAGQFLWKLSKGVSEAIESGALLPNEQLTITVVNKTSL